MISSLKWTFIHLYFCVLVWNRCWFWILCFIMLCIVVRWKPFLKFIYYFETFISEWEDVANKTNIVNMPLAFYYLIVFSFQIRRPHCLHWIHRFYSSALTAIEHTFSFFSSLIHYCSMCQWTIDRHSKCGKNIQSNRFGLPCYLVRSSDSNKCTWLSSAL